jgi:hypothetical protein
MNLRAYLATPSSGWASDRFGVERIIVSAFILSIPWFMVMVIRSHLALFLVALVLSGRIPSSINMRHFLMVTCVAFCIAAVISPLTAELAYITQTHDGIGCTRHTNSEFA